MALGPKKPRVLQKIRTWDDRTWDDLSFGASLAAGGHLQIFATACCLGPHLYECMSTVLLCVCICTCITYVYMCIYIYTHVSHTISSIATIAEVTGKPTRSRSLCQTVSPQHDRREPRNSSQGICRATFPEEKQTKEVARATYIVYVYIYMYIHY